MTKYLIILLYLFSFFTDLYSQKYHADTIYLENQNQVDSFTINYPNYSEIIENVIIGKQGGSNINNLLPLNSITSIEGGFFICSNPHLKSLTGLESLQYVNGEFQISFNDSLMNVDGLTGLTSVGDILWIEWNQLFENLNGLRNLRSIEGSFVLGSLGRIMNMRGLDVLERIGGVLILRGNKNLINLEGLGNLNELGSINCYVNGALKSLYGIGNVDTLLSLSIVAEDGLESLAGLDGLKYVENDIELLSIPVLSSLSALSNLNTVYKSLKIVQCHTITDLTGLEGLTYVGEDLRIESNYQLSSINALSHMTSINGRIIINRNEHLSDISGIENCNADDVTELLVDRNPLLRVCDNNFVCKFLNKQNNNATIFDNGSGCDSLSVVEKSCGVGINEATLLGTRGFIYPNPASTHIHLSNSNNTLQLSTIHGQTILTSSTGEQTVSLEGISPGLYIATYLEGKKILVHEKLIIR